MVTYAARWLVPRPGVVIDHGELTTRDGWIVRAGRRRAGTPAIDLGDVALLPGLINCHAHLEFSHYRQPLGHPGIALADWLRIVVTQQRSRLSGESGSGESNIAAARREGWRESVLGGAAWVADVTTVAEPIGLVDQRVAADPAKRLLAAHMPLCEVLGATSVRAAEVWAKAAGFAEARAARARWTEWGLSPHAPYTAPWPLIERTAALAARRGCTLAMHLAESREELDFVRDRSGPLRELLEQLGAWEPGAWSDRRSIEDYLQIMSSAPRSLVVHGNYLTPEQCDAVAERRQRMALVYCPRTHAYFRHDAYPLADRVGRGVRVVLGTDSRASNPDLSIWREWVEAARRHDVVDPWRVLGMVTTDAASALGISDHWGQLAAGYRATYVIARPPTTGGSLIERLIDAQLIPPS